MRSRRIAIVGAGIGGLAAAIDLARTGERVTVFERARGPGGKIRQAALDSVTIDAGPTVVTMKWVFEELFSDAGRSFAESVTTHALDILARHAFDGGSRLDLFADHARSAAAIGEFAGSKEARGFLDFTKRAHETYRTLENSFIRSDQPSPVSLAMGAGLKGLGDLWRISPFSTLWNALGDHFNDMRLRQLFARYATYCGSSPFDCPATLMLVADVERQGVWIVDGGMQRLAAACHELAVACGVEFRFETEVTRIEIEMGRAAGITLQSWEKIAVDGVIVNADPAAVSSGLFGRDVAPAVTAIAPSSRSLSAITFAGEMPAEGFPLSHHNVFFGRDYHQEFDDIFRFARVPSDPTVYVCAQDRGPGRSHESSKRERLFLLVNAPAIGDTHRFTSEEVNQCRKSILSRLNRCGLTIEGLDQATVTTPADFNRLFPATGGALYGQATHGWTASFTRPSARTRCPGLYLAGGAVHPGPGVPMAALSGRIAARSVVADLISR